jgi:hypothetical protein
MNERIKELWEEAAKTTQGDSWQEQTKFMQKFAELIVQECVHVAVFKDDGMISTADVAGYMAAGRASAAKIIKEHFGVEE